MFLHLKSVCSVQLTSLCSFILRRLHIITNSTTQPNVYGYIPKKSKKIITYQWKTKKKYKGYLRLRESWRKSYAFFSMGGRKYFVEYRVLVLNFQKYVYVDLYLLSITMNFCEFCSPNLLQTSSYVTRNYFQVEYNLRLLTWKRSLLVVLSKCSQWVSKITLSALRCHALWKGFVV